MAYSTEKDNPVLILRTCHRPYGIRSYFGQETNDASRTTYEVDGLLGHPADTSVIGRPRAETESNCGAITASLRGLARMIHEGSLRKRADAKREGYSET